jgi:hypothetical protein
MPELLHRPDLNLRITPIFLEYLQFILVPKNLATQNNSYESFCDTTMLFDDVISGYMNCGGDGNNHLVQQSVKERLISEDVFFVEDLQNWFKEECSLLNIYEVNEDYKLLKNKSLSYSAERRVFQEKNDDLNELLNVPKQFRSLFDRNDKVSVKYEADGKILNDVKYKKVEDDLISGKCELI